MTRVAALILILFAQQNEETIVLNHARLLTVSGEAVEGPLIVVGGKISRIGGDLPPGATVVDLAGKIVIPGLIDAGCTLGVAGPANEDGEEVAPQVRIVDSLDPRGVDLARARQSGVTAAFVEPGNRGVIGGVASLIRTSGRSRADMILRPEAALKAAIGPAPSQGNFPPRGGAASFFSRRPTTRMGVAWEFRKAFFDARKYADDHREEDPGKEVLLRALTGKLPVRISASRQTDLETAMQIADELGLSIVIEEGHEAYKTAEQLAKRNIPVLLRPSLASAVLVGFGEYNEARLDTFTRLTKAGVKTALLSLGDPRSSGLLASVSFAVRHGATPAQALRAVTLTPAEILGLADRMGSIEQGKDADLVVLSGEPHEATTRVEKVMIGGKWVYGERAGE